MSSVLPTHFKCLTPKGFVEPGRKYEVCLYSRCSLMYMYMYRQFDV